MSGFLDKTARCRNYATFGYVEYGPCTEKKNTGFLQDKICSRHDKLLEVFCCLDQQCICVKCSLDDHKGHTIVSASEERTEKQVSNEF